VSHGSGDNNINASHTHNLILPKIFHAGKDDSMSYVIDALANIIDELKQDGKER
jgi:hypothetical protein